MSQKKSVVVTGCSSGFGWLTAQTLAKSGHTVFATMRGTKGKNTNEAKKLTAWSKKGGHTLYVIDLDVTTERSVKSAITEVMKKTDTIDVVVNNAGIYTSGVNEAFSIKDMERIFDVNFYGPQRVIQAVLPYMRKKNAGLIINVSSALGRIPLPFTGVYSASKAALESLTETYRYELSAFGIDMVIVEPGAYPTGLISNHLNIQDKKVYSEYGSIKNTYEDFTSDFKKTMEKSSAPNPQQVADAISQVIITPNGKRPFRFIVDHSPFGKELESINKVWDKATNNTLKRMGMEKLAGKQETTTWNA